MDLDIHTQRVVFKIKSDNMGAWVLASVFYTCLLLAKVRTLLAAAVVEKIPVDPEPNSAGLDVTKGLLVGGGLHSAVPISKRQIEASPTNYQPYNLNVYRFSAEDALGKEASPYGYEQGEFSSLETDADGNHNEREYTDTTGYDHYKTATSFNLEGPRQLEYITSNSYHKEVEPYDVTGFHKDYKEEDHHHHEDEEHAEVHYHQHKHLHKHNHKQEHVHKHKQDHKHEHGHKHDHHNHHDHKHEAHHKHQHHEEHKHGHKNEHHHKHHQEHKHDHHAGHKHEHKHHQDHKHDHHHGHKHSHHHENKHNHHQDHKHDHHHHHKHHQEHKHKHEQHAEHKHKHGHKEEHKHHHHDQHHHKHHKH